jgi:aryl-alcohol dehydrogenase-like predicted oxidoreductase
VGEFIKGHRESVVLATKYSNAAPGNDPNAAGNRRKNMMQALEASLKRLQTDYIDLYGVHIWDGITPVEEVMRGLDDMVRQGKVLYVGISDAPAWWIAQANTLAELRGWTKFTGLQIEYNLIERTVERELVPMKKALNLGVLAWSPLARGVLTGKYHGDGKADGGRMTNEGLKEFLPEEQSRNNMNQEPQRAVGTDPQRCGALFRISEALSACGEPEELARVLTDPIIVGGIARARLSQDRHGVK